MDNYNYVSYSAIRIMKGSIFILLLLISKK
jgi:hypothetical protein